MCKNIYEIYISKCINNIYEIYISKFINNIYEIYISKCVKTCIIYAGKMSSILVMPN